ncbi:MAG: YbaN family protein [Anaerolineae bacterium]|nr:YbaN family protein [Anaerolineae bacterium]
MLRVLLIVSGTACVALAMVGILVPVLPTTPFLLLAAFLYARSSERFHHWLVTNRVFGRYIHNYRQHRGMLLRDKILTLTLLWLTLGSTILLAETAWWLILLLLTIGAAVTAHIVRIKTLDPQADREARARLQPPGET